MPRITFYPLGNADSYLVSLDDKNILYDFGNMGGEKCCDLPQWIKDDVGWPSCKIIDVVAFTHNDNDHVKGASEFFYLDHAKKYQSSDRMKIEELWVPAAMITDSELNNDDARILRQEARHRLKKDYGIKVFSRPKHLEEWLKSEGLTIEDRRHRIVNAGEVVDSVNLDSDGAEIFSHSPFGERDGSTTLDRNTHSLVQHMTVRVGTRDTTFFLGADTPHEMLDKIVTITQNNENDARLVWDVYKGPHHCSYLSLGPEKGKTKTEPSEKVQELLDQGQSHGIIVLTCDPIPSDDTDQPPHRQAHKTYDDQREEIEGDLVVTMERPNTDNPKRSVIEITNRGAKLKKIGESAANIIVNKESPRVG